MTGLYRVSTWIHWILLGFIGCFQVFKNTIDFCFPNLRLNQCVPGFKLVGPVFTEFLEVLPDFSVFNQQYRATLHITEFSRISTVLLMSSSLLRHGNRFPWHFLGFLPSFTEFCARVATVSGFLWEIFRPSFVVVFLFFFKPNFHQSIAVHVRIDQFSPNLPFDHFFLPNRGNFSRTSSTEMKKQTNKTKKKTTFFPPIFQFRHRPIVDRHSVASPFF